MTSRKPGLGTLLRHLLELLDGDLEKVYARDIPGYRPRYTPVMRTLLDAPGCTIREIATTACVSHSAASQTVSQMRRAGLLRVTRGEDAREVRLWLTPAAKARLPALRKQWAATTRAAAALEQDMGAPLGEVLASAIAALENRSFLARITESKRTG